MALCGGRVLNDRRPVVYYAESALVMARLPLVRLSASDWQFLFVQREPPTFVAAY